MTNLIGFGQNAEQVAAEVGKGEVALSKLFLHLDYKISIFAPSITYKQ